MKKLSIIIPVYNEEKTVGKLLNSLVSIRLPVKQVEYIIIDDGSTDASASIIKKFCLQNSKFTFIEHKKNKGKGEAIKTGLKKAKGDYIVIQDADLEYNPKDIAKLLKAVNNNNQIVYGTRLKRLPNFKEDIKNFYLLHYFGNRFLSLATSLLYQHWLTDIECCYKLFPKIALLGVVLQAKGFEFEPEITAKFLKKGYKIAEVSISTNPRGYGEGKKIHAISDGTKALWTLLKYRFID
jgi:dolichol-phosphate mannosyltransferase